MARRPLGMSIQELSEFILAHCTLNVETGCQEFQGLCDENGYGSVSWQGIMRVAHRLVWEAARGQIPKGMRVCHTCDNPPCCSLDHLWLGTPGDNDRDCARKGRRPAKLTAEQVLEVRARYCAGAESYSELGRAFGVSLGCIVGIVRRRTWAWLPERSE